MSHSLMVTGVSSTSLSLLAFATAPSNHYWLFSGNSKNLVFDNSVNYGDYSVRYHSFESSFYTSASAQLSYYYHNLVCKGGFPFIMVLIFCERENWLVSEYPFMPSSGSTSLNIRYLKSDTVLNNSSVVDYATFSSSLIFTSVNSAVADSFLKLN